MSRSSSQTPKGGAVGWMAGNSVAANVLMLLLLVGGLCMALNVKQEVFPDFTTDSVIVSVDYPGAGPEEVESGVVLVVEDAVQGVEGIEEISSTSAEGQGTVTIEALEDADLNKLWQDVKGEVDRIDTFPDEALKPNVYIDSRRREVILFALSGDADERSLREAGEEVRDRMLADPRITQVELRGVRDYEIHVEIPQNVLRRYGVSLGDAADAVAKASVEVGGGGMRTSGGEVLLRVNDKRETAQEYARAPLMAAEDGSRVFLEDVAEVSEGFEESDSWASFDGRRAILVEVYRVGGQTPMEIAEAAKEIAGELNATLPDTLRLDVLHDSSEMFGQRADLLMRNAYMGLALVFVCLAIFLETRLAFWVSMGIPISFLGAFLFMPLMGFTLNMITMFAFIVTLGIVVDDAIVVGENVYRHRRMGKARLRAAVDGALDVAMPVTFSVITNMVAFAPLLFVPGFMGKVFKFIPIVVICVFAVSLVESLFVLPAHLAHLGEGRKSGIFSGLHARQAAFSSAFERFVAVRYASFLRFCLERRYVVLALCMAVLTATVGYILSGRMGLVLFPKVESDFAYVEAVLPYGVSTERMAEVEKILTDAAEAVVAENGGELLAKGVFATVDENEAEARIFLTAPDVRPLGASSVTDLWRDKVGRIPGLESISFESDHGGPGSGKTLTVRLAHKSKETLDAAGAELARKLAEYEGVSDVDDGAARGKRQYDIHLLPAGERMGLSSRDVADQVRHAFYGAEAVKQQRGRNEVTVKVRLPEADRAEEATLEDLVLFTSSGEEVLLRDAAKLTPGRAYTSVNRSDGRRIAAVTANVTPQSRAEQVLADLQAASFPALKAKYPGLTFSFEGKQADMRESVDGLISGLLMAMLAIYALLAIPFRSYFQPFLVMICIPFGIVGAVFGHILMGYTLSILSLFGVVALSGVVINDSLVLVDFANRLRRAGDDPFSSVVEAAVQRFRPILLTTLTTFGGLAPMIFETSLQARFLIPMAISLGFGILFATGITLVMIPALYMTLEDVKRLFGAGAPREQVE